MKDQRPKNIGLASIRSYSFPITAVSSIMHRITGVFMVISLPFLLWAFSLSMSAANGFYYMQNILTYSSWSIFAWLFLSAVSYHILAGIRHLIMDFGYAEEMYLAKGSAVIVLLLGILVTFFWGMWIWVM